MHQHRAHATMFPLLSAENNMLSKARISSPSRRVLILALVSNLYSLMPQDRLSTDSDILQEGNIAGKQADICLKLHHITCLFYHAIPWNETSRIDPAFSTAVEEPSGQ